jgi:hypothetical protein
MSRREQWVEHRGVGPKGSHVHWTRGAYTIIPHGEGFLLHDWSGARFRGPGTGGTFPTLRAAQRRAGAADRVIRGQGELARDYGRKLDPRRRSPRSARRRDPSWSHKRGGLQYAGVDASHTHWWHVGEPSQPLSKRFGYRWRKSDGRVWAGYAWSPGASMSPVEHPAASGHYASRAEAERAIRAMLASKSDPRRRSARGRR